MNFKTILFSENKKDIINRMGELYPDQIQNALSYHMMIDTLYKKKIRKNNIMIILTDVPNEEDESKFYIAVSGKENDEIYSLMLSSWSNWLGSECDPESIQKYTKLDFIVHCLYEMTFFGFKEKYLINEKKKLHYTIKHINKKNKLISEDEFFQKFKSICN